MKAFKAIAVIGLLATAIGPILVFTGTIDAAANKLVMLIGMIVWFIGGIPWLGSNKLQPTDSQVEI
jgi:hypothetical protein